MMDSVKIIIVDNEALSTSQLQKSAERIFPKNPIFIATKFDKAIQIVKNNNENAILIVSMELPGLNGLKLVEELKVEIKPANYKYILSYYTITVSQKKLALRTGFEFFLKKPYRIEDILPILKNSADSISLQMKNNELQKKYLRLKENFDSEVLKIKNIIDLLIERKIEGISEKSKKIEKAAIWIASKHEITSEEDKNVISIASKLQFIGRLVLDDKFVKEPVMKDGRLNDAVMKNVPFFAHEVASRIQGYEKVCKVLKHQYENFDGTGFPDGKIGSNIPILSRILRVATDFFDTLEIEKKEDISADKIINESRRLYDYKITPFIDQYLGASGLSQVRGELVTPLKDLSIGHTISRNIINREGLVILGRDTIITEKNISMLRETILREGMIGDIYVYDLGNTEERRKGLD